jgi:hypothetical protein
MIYRSRGLGVTSYERTAGHGTVSALRNQSTTCWIYPCDPSIQSQRDVCGSPSTIEGPARSGNATLASQLLVTCFDHAIRRKVGGTEKNIMLSRKGLQTVLSRLGHWLQSHWL